VSPQCPAKTEFHLTAGRSSDRSNALIFRIARMTNPKQAIAIGLSQARKKGAKVPKKKG